MFDANLVIDDRGIAWRAELADFTRTETLTATGAIVQIVTFPDWATLRDDMLERGMDDPGEARP